MPPLSGTPIALPYYVLTAGTSALDEAIRIPADRVSLASGLRWNTTNSSLGLGQPCPLTIAGEYRCLLNPTHYTSGQGLLCTMMGWKRCPGTKLSVGNHSTSFCNCNG